MAALRFDEQTVIVTGASHGLGKQYITYIAEQGANVVVHDDRNPHFANELASKIRTAGGKAIATSTPLQNGHDIVNAAVAAFGRLDALILNAGDSLDLDWEASGREEWDSMLESAFGGCYKCVNAAWSHFKKQKYGRILCTSAICKEDSTCSPLLYSAKYGQLGFIQTIAREGAKYNIFASVLAPPATAGWMYGIPTSEMESIARAVAMLVHPSNKKESGNLFEISQGALHKLRWQRASGALLNPDAAMTPGAILDKWSEMTDFSRPEYSSKSADFEKIVARARALPPSPAGQAVRLDGKVALVTGAGAGLGGAYAKCLASLGARVVLNDVKEPSKVANEIQAAGGETHMVTCSVEEGEKIVDSAIKRFGRLDIIVNNAGFVRDKSIANMTDELWNSIMAVHLKGMFRVTKAAWPHLVKQGYGRIINVSSTSGIYGNFGQSNYSTAKAAIIGFSDALARLGAEHNILVNAVAPVASTSALAAAVQGSSTEFLPDYCGPFVAILSSDMAPFPSTGGLFEFGAGWHTRTRLQRSHGSPVPQTSAMTVDAVSKMWNAVADFDHSPPTYPEESEGGLRELALRLPQNSVLATIEDAKRRRIQGTVYEYGDREALLYNLTLGATWDELSLVNERDPRFQVLPTFGVIPFFTTKLPFTNTEILPNWDANRFLHGEHYLEIRKFPIPTSGRLITSGQLLNVVDKKKAAVVTVGFTTKDAETGEDVFYNESSLYGRGAGGFTGPASPPPPPAKQASTSGGASSPIPNRPADFVRSQTTTREQAALYRLNGDRNSIHVDPSVARLGGFPRPILHGLCFLGISGKHIFQQYGAFKNVRVRFAGTVLPGETLRTEMWREKDVVLFQTTVVETGKLCISGGRAELLKGRSGSRL